MTQEGRSGGRPTRGTLENGVLIPQCVRAAATCCIRQRRRSLATAIPLAVTLPPCHYLRAQGWVGTVGFFQTLMALGDRPYRSENDRQFCDRACVAGDRGFVLAMAW